MVSAPHGRVVAAMQLQRFIHALPPPLRRHKLIRALAFIDPASRVQRIRFNGDAQAFIDVGEGPLRTVMINASFEPEFFAIAGAFLDKGGVCFDVGANVGLCSFGLVPRFPRVQYHLFEANPALWPLLRRSIALHPEVTIRLVDKAVGENSRTVRLDPNNEDRDIGQAFISADRGVETTMISLDDYIRDSGVARVDFLKMDIEGYEYFALEGARRSVSEGKVPVVYFEMKASLVGRYGKTIAEVLQHFRSMGYTLYHVRERDFEHVPSPSLRIRGLRVAPVDSFPPQLGTDLLAIHASAGAM
jgi:FkbM family methyltransferase